LASAATEGAEATESDPAFAADLTALVAPLRPCAPLPTVTVTGTGAAFATRGGVSVSASWSSASSGIGVTGVGNLG
jgi:hypothetical protein